MPRIHASSLRLVLPDLNLSPVIDLEDSDDNISEIQQEIANLAQCNLEYVMWYYGSFVVNYKS